MINKFMAWFKTLFKKEPKVEYFHFSDEELGLIPDTFYPVEPWNVTSVSLLNQSNPGPSKSDWEYRY